jgi:hypothetical protein
MFAPLSLVQAKGKVQSPQQNQSPENAVRDRAQGFIAARQARNSVAIRRFIDPQDVKKIHAELKSIYEPTREGMKQGQFTPEYVNKSISEGTLATPYKEALKRYLLKNADFDHEMDQAFTTYLVATQYTITKFQIQKVLILGDGKTAETHVVEYRQGQGQKESQSVQVVYKWLQKNNNWYLVIDSSLKS